MNIWKTTALSSALVLAAGAGAAIAPVAQGQSRDPEALVRAVQAFGGDPQIGIEVRDTDSKSATEGAVVDDVRSDSPAEKAGIKRGDTIVEFDGERVRGVAQFQRLVQETPEGRTARAVVVRDGQRVTVSVTPERRRGSYFFDDDFPEADFPGVARGTPAPPPPPGSRPYLSPAMPGFEVFSLRSREGRLGITTESLTDQLNGYFGVKNGVLVRSVNDDSPAARAGVKAGDVIVAVNGRQVEAPSDVINELHDSTGGDFTLDVVRDRKAQTLKGKLEPRETHRRGRIL